MDYAYDFIIAYRDEKRAMEEIVKNCQSVADGISNVEVSFWGYETSFQDRPMSSMSFNICISMKESNVVFLNKLKDNFRENISQKYLDQISIYRDVLNEYDGIEELFFSFYVYCYPDANQRIDYLYLCITSYSQIEEIELFTGIENFIRLLFLLFSESQIIIHLPYVNLRASLLSDYNKVNYLLENLNKITLHEYLIPNDCIYYRS